MTSPASAVVMNDSELCVLCSTTHNRTRPSFCQCKHCSIPLCLDCMKQHHDEVFQTTTQLSHQYNELQELIRAKQTMVTDETTKFIEHVNHSFDTHITQLRQTQHQIIDQIQTTKQDALKQVAEISSHLHIIGIDIQSLTKESVVQLTKMNNLSSELKKIDEQLHSYEVRRSENRIEIVKPEFSIHFGRLPLVTEVSASVGPEEMSKADRKDAQEVSTKSKLTGASQQPSTVPKSAWVQRGNNEHFIDADEYSESSSDNDSVSQDSDVPTSYTVDRMASDGENILYTSYDDETPDLIAYCRVNDQQGRADRYYKWNNSRVKDMIWWKTIMKFICATKDVIYTVEYTGRRFEIADVLDGTWSYVRVAANSTHLFLWKDSKDKDVFNGIEVYSTNFRCVRLIDIQNPTIGTFGTSSNSFCVTNKYIALISKHAPHNHGIFQIILCDLHMNKMKSFCLGKCNGHIEIRTDGKDRFFISTGLDRFHIVRSDGQKKTITLQNDGECIAVLDDRRVAIGNTNEDMQVVTY